MASTIPHRQKCPSCGKPKDPAKDGNAPKEPCMSCREKKAHAMRFCYFR